MRRALILDQNAIIPLLILIPKKSKHPVKNHTKQDIALTEQLYARLIDLKIQFAIEVVVENIGEEIKFLIFVSRRHEDQVRELIQSLFTNAEVPEVDYYDLFSSAPTDQNPEIGKHTLVGYLSQTKPYLNPLTTGSDSFSQILQYLSELKVVGEATSIQWIVRPAHSKIKFDVSAHINQITAGQIPTSQIHPHLVVNKDTVRLLEEKISKPLIATNCRIAIHTSNPKSTATAFGKITTIFNQSHSQEHLNQVVLHKSKNQAQSLYYLLNHQFLPEEEMVLNTDELAALFHLPGQDTAIAKIKRE